MRIAYDIERQKDITAFRLKKSIQAVSWVARNHDLMREIDKRSKTKAKQEGRFAREPCSQTFIDSAKLTRHLQSTKHKKVIAGIEPNTKAALSRLATAKLIATKKLYCVECDQAFPRQDRLHDCLLCNSGENYVWEFNGFPQHFHRDLVQVTGAQERVTLGSPRNDDENALVVRGPLDEIEEINVRAFKSALEGGLNNGTTLMPKSLFGNDIEKMTRYHDGIVVNTVHNLLKWQHYVLRECIDAKGIMKVHNKSSLPGKILQDITKVVAPAHQVPYKISYSKPLWMKACQPSTKPMMVPTFCGACPLRLPTDTDAVVVEATARE